MSVNNRKCGRCKKTKAQCNCGRPTVMTDEVIRKLEDAFSNGATDIQACFYADISKTAFYNYQQEHPEFLERKEGLKAQLGLIAKNVLGKAIRGGDANKASWYLERKESDEYGNKNKNENRLVDQDGNDRDLSIEVAIIGKDTNTNT